MADSPHGNAPPGRRERALLGNHPPHVYIVGAASFTHIVAGSVETFYAAVTQNAAWGQVLSGYTLPTLLGNVLGGVALVAALNYGQVAEGKGKGKGKGKER